MPDTSENDAADQDRILTWKFDVRDAKYFCRVRHIHKSHGGSVPLSHSGERTNILTDWRLQVTKSVNGFPIECKVARSLKSASTSRSHQSQHLLVLPASGKGRKRAEKGGKGQSHVAKRTLQLT